MPTLASYPGTLVRAINSSSTSRATLHSLGSKFTDSSSQRVDGNIESVVSSGRSS